MRKSKKLDPFDLYGLPPAPFDTVPERQLAALRCYVNAVADRAARTAYDNGLVDGLTKISRTAAVGLRRQRERMLKSNG